MNLALRTRMAREYAGLSQEQLAERTKQTQQAIGRIESGKTLKPRSIEAIAAVLMVAPEWLMYGINPPHWFDPALEAPANPAPETRRYAAQVIELMDNLTDDQCIEILQDVERRVRHNQRVIEAYKTRNCPPMMAAS